MAPDMLGYGQSDKPPGPEEYSLKRISNDLASILDVIRVRKAVSPGPNEIFKTLGELTGLNRS